MSNFIQIVHLGFAFTPARTGVAAPAKACSSYRPASLLPRAIQALYAAPGAQKVEKWVREMQSSAYQGECMKAITISADSDVTSATKISLVRLAQDMASNAV
jgi:hypothetical protein